jgi:hypothetical protein
MSVWPFAASPWDLHRLQQPYGGFKNLILQSRKKEQLTMIMTDCRHDRSGEPKEERHEDCGSIETKSTGMEMEDCLGP